MPITQDRMQRLIAAATKYVEHADHLAEAAFRHATAVQTGTMTLEAAFQALCQLAAYPVHPTARAIIAEEHTHYRLTRAKNIREAERQRKHRRRQHWEITGEPKPPPVHQRAQARPEDINLPTPAGLAAAKQLVRELGLEDDDAGEINNMFEQASPEITPDEPLETRPDYIEPTPDEIAARQAMLDQILAQRKAEREAKLPPQVVRNGKPLP